MGRHGRQQLLTPRSRRSGQAIIELLPSVIIFFTVIVAALNYFRVMRAAVIRQETVRNAVFALISNSGTLTTPPNLLSSVAGDATSPAGPDGSVNVMKQHQFIGADARCFIVFPSDPMGEVSTPLFSMFSTGGTPSVDFLTYAVINRQPGGNCAE